MCFGFVFRSESVLHHIQRIMMAFKQLSAYCPTQRTYTMTLTNTAYQTSAVGGSSYQSLYSEERQDLDLLDVRKETFIFYPKSGIPTADIAAAGFYYTGEGRVIKCFCCKLTVTCLNDRDNPLAVHRSRAPNCPFVRKAITQVGALVPEPDEDEDMVDGFGLNPDSSLSSDVEADGPLQDNLVPHSVPKNNMGMQKATAARHLGRATHISKPFHLCTLLHKLTAIVCGRFSLLQAIIA